MRAIIFNIIIIFKIEKVNNTRKIRTKNNKIISYFLRLFRDI